MKSKKFLPMDIRCDPKYSGKTCLQAMGVRFMRIAYDRNPGCFQEISWRVKLPEGWEL